MKSKHIIENRLDYLEAENKEMSEWAMNNINTVLALEYIHKVTDNLNEISALNWVLKN